jgi:hypothetical protein
MTPRKLPGTWRGLLTCGLAATACAAAGLTPAPVPPQNDRGHLIFRGARVIVGDGRVIEDGAFVVRDGLFVEVGRAAEVAGSDGVAVDVQGKTIMPAIVNAHTHLGWEAYTSWGSQHFTRENLIDHLYRHAYYGVGTVISTATDRQSIGLPVQLDQRLGKIGGARYVPEPGSARRAAARIRTSPPMPAGGDRVTDFTRSRLRKRRGRPSAAKRPRGCSCSRLGGHAR